MRPAALVGAVTISALGHVAASPSNVSAARTCQQPGTSTHTVAEGDSWFDIARRAGVSTGSLLGANNADDEDVIFPGDQLCLPSGAKPTGSSGGACGGSASYTVVRGDSWFAIAQRAATRLGPLLQANQATAETVLHPGRALCMPAGVAAPRAGGTGGGGGAVVLEAVPAHGPCWYSDTWSAPRGNGRRHEGVDIIAGQGQYVYAVTDGTLTRRAWAQPGRIAGNAWWLTSDDGSGTYFFYAHLADFVPGLKVGSHVRAGEIIGFVGATGNAGGPHLHFEIHPNGGGAINPYQSVKAMGGCKSGAGYQQPSGWIPQVSN